MTLGEVILISTIAAIPAFLTIQYIAKAIWTVIKMWWKYGFRGMFKD